MGKSGWKKSFSRNPFDLVVAVIRVVTSVPVRTNDKLIEQCHNNHALLNSHVSSFL